jgi:hypothetical protein
MHESILKRMREKVRMRQYVREKLCFAIFAEKVARGFGA